MKKLLLTLLCLPMIGLGQEKSFELGLLCGGSYNSYPSSILLNEETLRPIGGLLAQYNFTSRFSIKSKFVYHVKGGSTQNMILGAGGAGPAYLDLHYLTLPLLAQLNFGNNKWRVFCNTGVYLGYLMKDELVESDGSSITNSIYGVNKLDFGIVLGSGVSFRFSERIKVFLESSFDYGFGKQAIITSTGVTYSFPIKKKVFNGTSTLDCPDYDGSSVVETKEKKKSKWRLVLYKDGNKVGGKSKKGKSRLFKKKN